MNLQHYRDLLLAKEKELVESLSADTKEVRDATVPDVEDEADLAVSSEEKDSLLNHSSMDSEILEQVRDALKRMDEGTYGLCLVCGRPINEKRLEAVPWAAYDVEHQAEVEKAQRKPTGGSTL